MPVDRVYWDACVFTSHIEGVPERAAILDAIIADARAGRIVIVTSAVSVAEVAYTEKERKAKELDPTVEDRIDRLWADSRIVLLVELHAAIARDARRLIRQGVLQGLTGLRANDAMHLATALYAQATVFSTYDERLAKRASALFLSAGPPQAVQPMLPLPLVNQAEGNGEDTEG